MSTNVERLQDCTDEELLMILDASVEKWNFAITWPSLQENMHRVFRISPTSNIDDQISITKETLIYLGTQLQVRNLMNKNEQVEILVKYNSLLEKVHYAQLLVLHYEGYKATDEVGHDYNETADNTMFRFKSLEYDTMKPFQKIVFKILDYIHTKNYKRRDDEVFEEIMNPNHTHAWKSRCKIIDLVHEQCNMIHNLENWHLLTSSRDMDKQLTEYFTKVNDERFPSLEKNRNVFSFKNGIYFSIEQAAVGMYTKSESIEYTDLFIAYDDPMIKKLAKSVTACKYFDMDFRHPNTKNIDEIKTPFMDAIYSYQKLDTEVQSINKMFMGRMLYDVGQLDNWQVILMLLGAGGSGKSTISNIIRMFYESEDVGIMGNNFSKIFGLADIYDKFVFLAPEIKRDWGIDQAEFQEIVSGGKINVNIKHQKSKRIEWTAPGLLGGNENPGFTDNASSIQRRVVVTRFDYKVDGGDPFLAHKLEKEIDCILKVCNLHYLQYMNTNKNQDIWKWLPSYFMETQKMMAAASNALHAFLDSDVLEFDESLYIPMDEFFKRLNIFCVENNFQKPKINVDFYRAPFAKYNILVKNKMNLKYPANQGKLYKSTTFLCGVDFKKNEDDDEYNMY